MKELNIYLGKRIKELRENKKLTQDFMSRELDISTNHYGRIERGENSCTINNFIKICNLLQVTPNEMIGNAVNIDNSKLDIIYNYNKLPKEDKEIVDKIIEFLLQKYC